MLENVSKIDVFTKSVTVDISPGGYCKNQGRWAPEHSQNDTKIHYKIKQKQHRILNGFFKGLGTNFGIIFSLKSSQKSIPKSITFVFKKTLKITPKITSFWEGGGPTNQLFAPWILAGVSLAPKGPPDRPRGGPDTAQRAKSSKDHWKSFKNHKNLSKKTLKFIENSLKDHWKS